MMKPGSPWRELPNEYLDREFSSHRGYRAFQEYFCISVKPEVINEYLLGAGICAAAQIEVERFSSREMRGSLVVEGVMRVMGCLKQGGVGSDHIRIKRTFNRNNRECHFDLMGAGKVGIAGFGVEYYRRVIPLLRELGIERITTMPTTGPDNSHERHRLVGAYVWSFYGYSNDDMAETLVRYIDYLKKIKKIRLDRAAEDDILAIKRMLDLAKDELPNGEETGRKFLLGLDARDKPLKIAAWHGTHHDINDESLHNEEMTELIAHLLSRTR
jgi:hypothetical protein